MAATSDPYLGLIAAALTGGTFKVLLDLYKTWKNGPPAELKGVTLADANLASVAKARDELIEDNIRLRQQQLEQDERHARERTVWLAEQDRLRKDIADMETRIERMRAQVDLLGQQNEALMRQVRNLGLRTDQLKEDSS
jgi:hypothetical protein